MAVLLRCLAGFKCDGVRGQRARFQGRREAGDQVFVGQVAAEKKDLEQCAGAVAFSVRDDFHT
ncbi:hypothetical protein ABZT34_35005 [Streptomyces sp. NPDC005329]|uniref:hypothetical protein n=1 Tax=Streptomyces sp. NPDC005329 TaxID=3157034 RepID=UPI0033A6F846